MPKFLDQPEWYNGSGNHIYGVGISSPTPSGGCVCYTNTNTQLNLLSGTSGPALLMMKQWVPSWLGVSGDGPTFLKYENGSFSWGTPHLTVTLPQNGVSAPISAASIRDTAQALWTSGLYLHTTTVSHGSVGTLVVRTYNNSGAVYSSYTNLTQAIQNNGSYAFAFGAMNSNRTYAYAVYSSSLSEFKIGTIVIG